MAKPNPPIGRTEKDSAPDAASDLLVSSLSNPQEIWQSVQSKLKSRLGERVHMSWTGQLSLTHCDSHSVALTAPSKFVASRINDRYGDLVREIWARFDKRAVVICAAADVNPSQKPVAQKAMAHNVAHTPRPKQSIPQTKSALRGANDPTRPNRRFTFDNFVVGPSNELAVAAARLVAENRTAQYNPLIIHGPHGMGKTHLLYAIKAHIEDRDPTRRVRFIPAEQFVVNFVQSVRAKGRGDIDAFKADLRDVDLLIIDDAHFIADKPGSQEELLHTLISLVEQDKQVLLATDRHPHLIASAQERLKSYMCAGLVCDIGPADYELRLRILDRLVESRRSHGNSTLTMPSVVRDMLAARINATPRDLEGAFNQIVARLEFLGKPLNLESVEEALSQSRYATGARPSVDKIQKLTARHFNISLDELLSKRRARVIARPRQIAMYLCKTLTTRSLPDIGRRFGGRDHTTVIHAVKRIESLCQSDPALKDDVDTLLNLLQN